MARFFKRFLFISILFGGLIILVNVAIERVVDKNKFFKLSGNPVNIICGHSRPEYAYNDSMLSSTKNIAQSAESYFYTYIKLRKVVAANPEIKRVFVEFTDNNIDDNESKLWTYGDKYLPYRYIKYSPEMTLHEKKMLFFHNPFEFMKSTSLALSTNLSFVMNKSNDAFTFKIMGGFKQQHGSHIDSLKNTVGKLKQEQEKFIKNFYVAVNSLNLTYLDKIVRLCKEKKIDIFFVRSPVYSSFKSEKIEKIYDSILITRYPDINLIDFSNYQLLDEEYYDFHHVNCVGTQKITKLMDSIMHQIETKPAQQLFTKNRINIIK